MGSRTDIWPTLARSQYGKIRTMLALELEPLYAEQARARMDWRAGHAVPPGGTPSGKTRDQLAKPDGEAFCSAP